MSLLTEKELCKMLGISRSLLLKLRNQGLPYIRVGEKLIRYDLQSVNDWFIERTQYNVTA